MERVIPGLTADWFKQRAERSRCYFSKHRLVSFDFFGTDDDAYLALARCQKGEGNWLVGFSTKEPIDLKLEAETAFAFWSRTLPEWACPNCGEHSLEGFLGGFQPNRKAAIGVRCRRDPQTLLLVPMRWFARLEPHTIDDVLDAHELLKTVSFPDDLFAKNVAHRVQTS